MNRARIARILAMTLIVPVAAAGTARAAPAADDDSLKALLERTSRQVSAYVDVISKMDCVERVTQLKLNESGKEVEKRESSFQYLVLLSHVGNELNLSESRVAVPEKSRKKEQTPLLLSNGFSLLFLVFHPYYAPGFEFSVGEPQTVNGRPLTVLHFRHIRGTRSPAALALRGREYQMDLDGIALVDPASGVISKITVGLAVDMEDLGLRKFVATIDYAPVAFQSDVYWLPELVIVDAQSRHQHWRNIHQFSRYKRFGVATTEKVKVP